MAAGKGFDPVTALSALAANVVSLQDKTVKPVTTKKMDDKPSAKRGQNYMIVPWRAAMDKRINKTAAYLVLTIICGYTNRHGETWVSQDTVAEILDVTRQAVSKQIARLVELGYIEIIRKGQKHFSSRMRVVFDPKMTLEEVKANTPAALREDNIETTPVTKEVARERIANLKNMIKGKGSAQPQELRRDDVSAQPQKLTQDDSQRNQKAISAQPKRGFSATSGSCTTEVEHIRTKWLEE